MQPGRKTFCQATEKSIGKFGLKTETSPGGEQNFSQQGKKRKLCKTPLKKA
jgi:hypothetical protein